jgi:hypothetical protein
MLKFKTRLILKSKLDELKMNLENNYKDLAHAALKDYLNVLEQLKADNMINDKDYLKYKKIGEGYKNSMVDYHH